MKINFNYVQDKQNIDTDRKAGSSRVNQKDIRTMISGVSFDITNGMVNGQVYGKQKKTLDDIKNQTSGIDASSYKNYMAVMAGSMSDEDYKALIKDGVKPGKVEVSEAVTIMDHIKAAMAQSGIVISGFNGVGELSMEKLESMTGDKGYAQAIASSFIENDVPLTEDNVNQVLDQMKYASQIEDISDGSMQYLLENGLEPTIDNLYKAGFSTSDTASESKSGYFADDLTGYYGKKPESETISDLQNQINKVIQEAGLIVNTDTQKEASWLLDKGLLLTPDNLQKLDRMNQMQLPMNRDEILSHITQTLREGKPAKDSDLSCNGIYKQAAEILNKVGEISEEAVNITVSSGESFNIRNLSRVQLEINLNLASVNKTQFQDGNPDQSGVKNQLEQSQSQTDQRLIHANRVLQEVRLQMTVSANILLLKSDYSIETADLEDLVDNLKNLEQQSGKDYGIAGLNDQNRSLYQETVDKTDTIKGLPAAVIGQIFGSDTDFTLNNVYKQGTILQSTYQKAGLSYEALMTAPRPDMGDKIQNAFRNVDELLSGIDMEPTKDNQRAVRILAYNQMEITKENVIRVREADTSLQNLLEQMKPWNTLKMIRDGVNPLDETVADLSAYFSNQNDLTQEADKFSKFLYKLEHDKQISKEERDSYIGIYRLIRQVEKRDGKAIGTVIANGQELTFANLLSAVRTSQKKSVNEVIDNDYGVLSNLEKQGESISDQIYSYYSQKASRVLTKIDPQLLQQENITMDSYWDDIDRIMEPGIYENQPRYDSIQNELMQNEAQHYRENLYSSEEVVSYLLENNQIVTVDNMTAAKKMLKDRGEMFRTIDDLVNHLNQTNGMDDSELMDSEHMDHALSFDSIIDHLNGPEEMMESYDNFVNQISDQLTQNMYLPDMGYLDVRALSLVSKQLALANNMTKEENYELPAIINGELTSVNVHFKHENRTSGNARIQISLTNGDKLIADFNISNDKVHGYIGCNSNELSDKLHMLQEDFMQNILSETGKETDINIIYSKEITFNNLETQTAGKQLLTINQEKTEEVHGSHTSAKELYKAAKSFIKLLQRV